MSSVVSLNSGNPVPKKSHVLLGKKFSGQIEDFAKRFPLSQHDRVRRFEVKDFDLWLEEMGHLVVPPMDPPDETGMDKWTPKDGAKSDGWVAHTHRRYQLLKELNKAAGHTRVRDDLGLRPFHVAISHGTVFVRPTQEKLALGDLPREVQSVIATKKVKVMRLLDSADFSLLPPAEQSRVEQLADAIEGFEGTVAAQTVYLSRLFDRLRLHVDAALRQGQFVPVNGGVKALLQLEDEGLDADDDAEDSLTA